MEIKGLILLVKKIIVFRNVEVGKKIRKESIWKDGKLFAYDVSDDNDN